MRKGKRKREKGKGKREKGKKVKPKSKPPPEAIQELMTRPATAG